jgi:hypothetical protein
MRLLALATRLALGVVAGLALGAPGVAAAQARSCHALPFSPSAPPAPPKVTVPPPEKTPITLPVYVRYMKSTDRRHVQANDLERVFSEGVVLKLFGDSSASANAIWRQAKVRLSLHRVEACDYDPAAFDVESDAKEEIPSPMAGDFGQRVFRKINTAFNSAAPPGVDVYLWMDIRAGLVGYGASHRRTPTARVGAVWVDKGCVETLGARCTGLVAHEIGHFLGLCHSCENSLTDSGVCTVCLPKGAKTAPVCGSKENFLMRPWFDGTRLTECEIGQARLRAAERVNAR